MTMLFTEWKLPHLTARNRVVRSATYEGLADERGHPREALGQLYRTLAANDVGVITTGFCHVSRQGRAMQPAQCGIDADDKIAPWEKVVVTARGGAGDVVLLMQLAHAGLQTLPSVTGLPALAPSVWRSSYFKTRPRAMTEAQIAAVIGEFAAAAHRAQQAGFDGVQIHAAHGYLVHQFLSPQVNRRADRWGRDRFALLEEIVGAIKERCGEAFPVFVKLSAGDDNPRGVDVPLAVEYATRMAAIGVEAVEVSFGTMDVAFNIFRGGAPVEMALKHNPLFARKPAWQKALWQRWLYPQLKRRFLPFRENYNLEAARAISAAADLPVILVGGLREREAMERVLREGAADAVALCRPLIREPDLIAKFRRGAATRASCGNCNICAVMCDSQNPLQCYRKGKDHVENHA